MKDNRWKQLNAILDEAEVYGRAIGKVVLKNFRSMLPSHSS